MHTGIMPRVTDIKRVTVNIYRAAGYRCANGGPSDNLEINEAVLCDSDDMEAMIALQDSLDAVYGGLRPVFRLVRRTLRQHGIMGDAYEYVHAEPIRGHLREKGFMFGGALLHCSDSRFNEMTGCHYPIKLHDRQE